MAQTYRTVTSYVATTRLLLQDNIAPYRYTDQTVIRSLNMALNEMGRLRPDAFLDLKYQNPLNRGDIGDGLPGPYSTSDIALNADDSYNESAGTLVPVPSKYCAVLDWFMPGWLQILDVADTQDQRAQAFLVKFQTHLLTTAAA
jgi:hypothetical protein